MNGEVKGPQVFNLLWNHTEKAVITEPEYKKLFSRWTALRGKMEEAAAKRVPQAVRQVVVQARRFDRQRAVGLGPDPLVAGGIPQVGGNVHVRISRGFIRRESCLDGRTAA